MAMINDYVIDEVGDSAVTAVGFNASKRQVLFGFQDGTVTAWDIEDNRQVNLTAAKHAGWITAFLYLPRSKQYLVAGIDGILTVMQATQHVETINLEDPVYAMALNYDRNHLIIGVNGGVKLYELDEARKSGSIIRKKPLQLAREHTDIVRCIAVHDGKLYTGGYDRKMIIYETSYASREVVRPMIINSHSHTSGITALHVVTDSDQRTWILTGCFDKVFRIWSLEGHLVHRLDLPETITAMCYVSKLDTVWVAARSNKPYVVDLKTAENISAFVETDQTFTRGEEEQSSSKAEITIVRYIPEYQMIVAATNRKHVIIWRYYYSACAITLHHESAVNGLTYSPSMPHVFYAADCSGDIFKWERSTANPYLYSKDLVPFSELTYRKIRKQVKQDNLESFLKYPSELGDKSGEDVVDEVSTNTYELELEEPQTFARRSEEIVIDKVSHMGSLTKIEHVESLQMIIASSEDSNIYIWLTDEKALQALEALSGHHSVVAHLKNVQSQSSADSERMQRLTERMKLYSILVTPEFCEQRDRSSSMLSTARSSIIPGSVQALAARKPFISQIVTQVSSQRIVEKRFSTVAHEDYDEATVTRKLAGYSCKHVLAGHTSVVTCFVVIPPRKRSERSELLGDENWSKSYMLSCGWDARICIWDLEKCALQDVFRKSSVATARRSRSGSMSSRKLMDAIMLEREQRELACDGVILDVCYCSLRNEFAYASSDKTVYIRRFSPVGSEMVLLGMLQGHADDVTGVRWNSFTDHYVTASEDYTVRVWNGTGLNECLHIVNTNGVAQAIAVDSENGAIVIGDRNGLMVYDCTTFTCVQENRTAPTRSRRKDDDEIESGPVINSILHIPERRMYATASTDGCIRLYNAWIRPKKLSD